MLINNACQTIRRPAAYYHHMIAGEKAAASRDRLAWTSDNVDAILEAKPGVIYLLNICKICNIISCYKTI